MLNNSTFEHRPISQLMAIVKSDLRKFDNEGLIDDGNIVKTIMYCNDKLGINIREVKEVAIPVIDYKAELPYDFEKLYFACALNCSNTMTTHLTNPFNNNFDQDVIYKACLNRDTLGCEANYQVVIQKQDTQVYHNINTATPLAIDKGSDKWCHMDCPNRKRPGKYTISIKEDHIETPFRAGELYIMYIGMMRNEEGEILFPFHPMITPYYEWMIKEKVLSDAMFNSDAVNIGELYKLAQQERVKAWIDAFNFTTDKDYGEYVKIQRKRELGWYNEYFKYLK